jgi:putative glutamine amidotransferase
LDESGSLSPSLKISHMPASNNHVVVPFRSSERVKPYLEALRTVGIDPAPHLTEHPGQLDGAAGLLLMGGVDVNPSRYGELAGPDTDAPDDERDLIELEMLDQAIQKDLPIFAICRGLQLLNVYHGGTLVQHLASVRHDPDFDDRAKPAHEVRVEEGTLLRDVVGVDVLRVNSRHHQAVATVGAGLRVSARDAEDGTVEGLERPGKRFILAVQWHPEDQVRTDPRQLRLFEQFAKAVIS